MALFKRGPFWWYEFLYKGVRIRQSARVKNKVVAREFESARRTQLAKGKVGLSASKSVADETQPTPIFREYAARVLSQLKSENMKPATLEFYEKKTLRLLEFSILANAALERIDRQMINDYIAFSRREKTSEKRTSKCYRVAPATTNRELATLRMILNRAADEGLIEAVPTFKLLNGERKRDFVLTPGMERLYLDACPMPLEDGALLLDDTGLRIGEALSLTSADEQLAPSAGFKYGFVKVRHGKDQERGTCCSADASNNEDARRTQGAQPSCAGFCQ